MVEPYIDYGAPSMDDMVDHDIDDTSTSMDYMAEHHHHYDYDAATVHDMESYTDFDPSSINVMTDHYNDYNSNDVAGPYMDYDSSRHVKDLPQGATHHVDDDTDDESPPRRYSRTRTQDRLHRNPGVTEHRNPPGTRKLWTIAHENAQKCSKS